MRIALFDLDYTLIPFDSGMAWTRFLIARGALPRDAEARYLAYCQQYVDGTLDIHDMHRAMVQPVAAHGMTTLRQWGQAFQAEVAPRVPASTRALVQAHRDAGDLCAIVTATTRFVAEPLARVFGLEHLVCTEPAIAPGTATEAMGGHPSGEIDGEPCYREGKIHHVQRWLAGQGLALESAAHSVFYSDSSSDLPLLEAVREPVAVWPDPKLRAHAARQGWRVLEPDTGH